MCPMDTQTQQPDDLELYLAAVAREGSYAVERPLGSGDSAGSTELVMFRGVDGAALGPFVRKRIDLATGVGGAYEALWAAERAGRRFRHLPRVAECYKTGSELVVVAEYVPGRTLEEEVAACGASPELARRIFPALCEAVGELHELFDPPLIHRDLKPQNVIVAPEGLFLIDLGIARRFHEGAGADTVRFGTRAYAPPEQYGFGQTDVRSDVYALGMLLWYCLVGEEPPVPFGEAALAQVGRTYAEVIARATAFDPEARYASVRELGEAFARASGGARVLRGDGRPGEGERAEAAEAALTPAPASAPAPAAPEPVQPADPYEPGEQAASPRRPERQGGFFRRIAAWPRRIATWANRLPAPLGIAWNVFVLLIYLLLASSCVSAVVQPTEADRAYPVWFLALEYLGMTLSWVSVLAYLVLDKRRLRRRIPWLAQRTWRQDARFALIVVMATLTVTVVARMALG